MASESKESIERIFNMLKLLLTYSTLLIPMAVLIGLYIRVDKAYTERELITILCCIMALLYWTKVAIWMSCQWAIKERDAYRSFSKACIERRMLANLERNQK